MSTVIYTNGIPMCPYCQEPTRRSGGGATRTLMYFQPVYDEHGNNTNPDRNITTRNWTCLKCGKNYGESVGGDEGAKYITY